MIKLWIDKRVNFYDINKRFFVIVGNNGSVDLSNVIWFDLPLWEPSDVKIGIGFLTKGYEI